MRIMIDLPGLRLAPEIMTQISLAIIKFNLNVAGLQVSLGLPLRLGSSEPELILVSPSVQRHTSGLRVLSIRRVIFKFKLLVVLAAPGLVKKI